MTQEEYQFWLRVDKTTSAVFYKGTRCWEWTGSRTGGGDGRKYGQFSFNSTQRYAHRVSWYFKHGRHPSKCILHKCDNRLCVRPSHLVQGTQRDNILDMIKKGRNVPVVSTGEHNPNAKLTYFRVLRMRHLARLGTPRKLLAHVFGVKIVTVSKIVNNHLWK